METIWRKKRAQSGMTRADMAKELGVEYSKYRAMERGEIKMPSKLMDKFNEIVNRGQHVNKLEQLDKQNEIDAFWNEMSVKENGQYKLVEKMKTFNIDTFKELAQLLGYKDGSIFSTRLAHPEETPIEFKTKVYNFFIDELNIQIPKEKKKVVRNKKKIEEVIETIEGVSTTLTSEEEMILPISDEPVEEPEKINLTEKYEAIVSCLDKEIAELSLKVVQLGERRNIYLEVLSDIKDRGV